MFSKFNKEQLEKLALYTTGINTILLEALLADPSPEDVEEEIGLEIHIVERGREPESSRNPKKE